MSQKHNHRYPGVQPFSKGQAHLFFGRDEDTERLFDLILLEKLVVLFGKSGYGKSSLLNAGVLPLLDKETGKGKRTYLPVIIRFNAYGGGSDTLFTRIKFYLMRATNTTSTKNLPHLPLNIWSDLKSLNLGKDTTVLFYF